MGWRGRGGGRSGRWPGRGPFSDLPPWRRPGRVSGYGRDLGTYSGDYRSSSSYNCARFPGLPRWWWADPEYASKYPGLMALEPSSRFTGLDPEATREQEKEFLEQQRDWISSQLDGIKKRLEELKETE